MWTVMPSSTTKTQDKFFTELDLKSFAKALDSTRTIPLIKGKVWAGEDRSHGWTIECENFEGFCAALRPMSENIKFLALDESHVDEDALRIVQEDLHSYAEEENISGELVAKAISALRSHENELFAVFAYAFLTSGQVIFVRAQTELAQYIFHPDRLLSTDALTSVRKLKTLVEN